MSLLDNWSSCAPGHLAPPGYRASKFLFFCSSPFELDFLLFATDKVLTNPPHIVLTLKHYSANIKCARCRNGGNYETQRLNTKNVYFQH